MKVKRFDKYFWIGESLFVLGIIQLFILPEPWSIGAWLASFGIGGSILIWRERKFKTQEAQP
jgi:hypothetical protein